MQARHLCLMPKTVTLTKTVDMKSKTTYITVNKLQ